jgi:hypothetical protein
MAFSASLILLISRGYTSGRHIQGRLTINSPPKNSFFTPPKKTVFFP